MDMEVSRRLGCVLVITGDRWKRLSLSTPQSEIRFRVKLPLKLTLLMIELYIHT